MVHPRVTIPGPEAVPTSRPKRRPLGASAVAAGVAAAMLALAPQVEAGSAPDGFADLAQKLLPGVVNVSTMQVVEGRAGPQLPQLPPGSPLEDLFKEFFDRNRPQQRNRRAQSLGSGFIIDAAGFVVTNNHVIQDAEEISVILHDNTRLKAQVVGRDAKTDLAVLKVSTPHKLTPLEFGDSDRARVGDWIIAIGNPFGLGGTVTAGIISARGRDINSGPYDDFIQTDASINRGNSGGPMFDLQGKVIGINTAIFSPSGGSVGIGFAIPSATAKPVIDQLVKDGQVRRGWLGVHIQNVTDEIAENLGLGKPRGAMVASVIKDGPAEKAKILAGDVILRFDGKEVDEMRRLPRLVAETAVGHTAEVVVWRSKAEIKVKVTVGELKEEEPKTAARPGGDQDEQAVDLLGLTLSAATPRVRERFDLGDNVKGVVVTGVDENGPAAGKGVRPGDVIVEVNQEPVTTVAEVRARVEDARQADKKTVLFLLEGQGGLRFVAIRVGRG